MGGFVRRMLAMPRRWLVAGVLAVVLLALAVVLSTTISRKHHPTGAAVCAGQLTYDGRTYTAQPLSSSAHPGQRGTVPNSNLTPVATATVTACPPNRGGPTPSPGATGPTTVKLSVSRIDNFDDRYVVAIAPGGQVFARSGAPLAQLAEQKWITWSG